MSFLVRSKILGLLVKMLTAVDRYVPIKTEKIPLPIKNELSKKQKILFCVFIKLLECSLNFEDFGKLLTTKDVVT